MHTNQNIAVDSNKDKIVDKDPYTEEIDLYELILILKKRINVIIITTLIGFFIGLFYILTSPNIYLARASIWIDTISDNMIVRNFLEYLKKEYINIKDLSFIFPFLTKQQRPAYLDDFSLSVLNTLSFRKKILEISKEQFKDSQDILKEIERLEKNLTPNRLNVVFEAKIGKNKSIEISSEQKNKKLAEEILRIAIIEFEKEIKELSKIYRDNQKEDEDFIIVKIIEQPVSFDKPIKPKKTMILGITTLASFFLGIVLAFVLHWWQSVKKNESN